jgi:hypothetical protein
MTERRVGTTPIQIERGESLAECLARHSYEAKAPWLRHELKAWSIVGMNHYHVGGERRLYVSMTWQRRICITAEGPDGPEVWDDLARQATREVSGP